MNSSAVLSADLLEAMTHSVTDNFGKENFENAIRSVAYRSLLQGRLYFLSEENLSPKKNH